MLLRPDIGEIIELSDHTTGFRGGRPSRPYLCYAHIHAFRIAAVPLSRRGEDPHTDFVIPVSAAHGLTDDSYIVDWRGTVDYLESVQARSLGLLEAELRWAALDHVSRMLVAE